MAKIPRLLAVGAWSIWLTAARTAAADPPRDDAIGTKLMETYRSACDEVGPSEPSEEAPHCDELAYDAAHAFRRARSPAKAIAAYRMLITYDERARARSPLAAKAMRELGEAYGDLALYDFAADWYERFAKTYPQDEGAASALSDAAMLRLGLGDDEQATRDARAFAKAYGNVLPTQTADLAFALGSSYADHEEWDKARAMLVGSMATIDAAALDVRLRAHALLGRVYARSGDGGRASALAEYATVRKLFSDPKAVQTIRDGRLGDTEAQSLRRLAGALNDVGEALVAAADERRRLEVEPLTPPARRAGTPSEQAAGLAEWLAKRRAAIEAVEADYVKVLDLKPVPPPRWVIAAASRVGLMWAALDLAFTRLPIPDAWTKPVRLAYLAALDQAREPIKARRMKPALQKCVDLAAKFQVADESSRACEAALAKGYRAEFHPVDEAIPALRAGPRAPAPPVVRDGVPQRE